MRDHRRFVRTGPRVGAGARGLRSTRPVGRPQQGALGEADRWIHAELPDASTSTVDLDLTSLASVHTAATAIQDVAPEIHVLMNNAG